MTTALPDSLQIVPKQLLRDATKRIDTLDMRVHLLTNRLAERDSVMASRDQEWSERVQYWRDFAEQAAKQGSDWLVATLVTLALAAGVYMGIWAQKQ